MVAAAADPVGRADLLADLGARPRRPGPVTVLLIGEPGIGKTTLWSAALSKVDADWSWSTRCLQAEAGLGLAALADLFATVPDDVLEALPTPQRRAVDTVLFRGIESTATAAGESPGNRAAVRFTHPLLAGAARELPGRQVMTTMTATDTAGQQHHRSPVGLFHRVWTAIVQTNRDADPLGVQMLVGCRFWHMPPSPLELEHFARVMSDRAGPIRDRL